MTTPKPQTPRSRPYMDWVKAKPCANCGYYASDPAHQGTGGKAIKSSDYTCIPLCRSCHDNQHNIPLDFGSTLLSLWIEWMLEKEGDHYYTLDAIHRMMTGQRLEISVTKVTP